MPRTRTDEASRGRETPGETQRTPPRRRGGQELPDELQDRPEQNEGYDRAARGGPAGTPKDPLIELDTDLRVDEQATDGELVTEPDRADRLDDIDERASERAAADVRRRERRTR
jgi:hypothetical protein